MTPDAVFRKNPDVVFRRIGDECLLVPIVNNVGDLSNVYTLNETGARTWELLDGVRSVGDVCRAIEEEYEVSAGAAAEDISEFIREFVGIELLEKT